MLEIKNLHATVDGKEILRGINLTMRSGEVHAIMGPNGSGKSTLSYVLSGRDGYEVTDGSVTYNGKDLLVWNPRSVPVKVFFWHSSILSKFPVCRP